MTLLFTVVRTYHICQHYPSLVVYCISIRWPTSNKDGAMEASWFIGSSNPRIMSPYSAREAPSCYSPGGCVWIRAKNNYFYGFSCGMFAWWCDKIRLQVTGPHLFWFSTCWLSALL